MQTKFLAIGDDRLAYEVAGNGPLVVLSPGLGNRRQAYRFLTPLLIDAGYRVASADLRGHGESSLNWTSYDGSDAISRTDVAGDLLALIRHLDGSPAVIVGHSLSGGAATIAAATAPELVAAIVEVNPFTKTQRINLPAMITVGRYRRGMLRLAGALAFKNLGQWFSYLDVAYPRKPADYDADMEALAQNLREPGRFAEFLRTNKSTPADAEAQLPHIQCPALVIMGSEDPDFPDPRAEGEAVVALMPAGLGRVEMSPGSGHYPHADAPERVAELILSFLAAQRTHDISANRRSS